MARRRVTSRVQCAKPGCGECAHFEYDSMRERDESEKRRREFPWRCYRHSREEEVLSADNPVRETVVTVARLRNPRYERETEEYKHAVARRSMYARKPSEFYDSLYWDGANNGIVSGPGFRALAEDFPEGTRLVVSARLILPDDTHCGDELHGADGGPCPTCGHDSHPIPDAPVDASLSDFPVAPVGLPTPSPESKR